LRGSHKNPDKDAPEATQRGRDRYASASLWLAMEATDIMSTILLIILIILLIGALPSWGYSRSWGYGPSGLLGVILIIVLILFLLGHIH
jgi:hypothetical protein